MSIWEYANPKKFMQTSTMALPWVSGLAVVLLVAGLVWGFFFTPDDYNKARPSRSSICTCRRR